MAAMATATVASAKQRATSSASAKSSSEGNATDDEDAAVAAALGEAGAEALESADASEDEGDAGPASTTTWSSAAPPAGPSGRGTGAASSAAAFDAAWREQLSREGLVGALVAAAYPDRIAERKDRSNKRAAFTLSSGKSLLLPALPGALPCTFLFLPWTPPRPITRAVHTVGLCSVTNERVRIYVHRIPQVRWCVCRQRTTRLHLSSMWQWRRSGAWGRRRHGGATAAAMTASAPPRGSAVWPSSATCRT